MPQSPFTMPAAPLKPSPRFTIWIGEIAGAYVHEVARIGSAVLGRAARPVTELARCRARAVFVAAFDAERVLAQVRPYLPDGAAIFTLDAMRIPADRLTNSRSYLDPLNFATNYAFFRDAGSLHTRLVTANYWSATEPAKSASG